MENLTYYSPTKIFFGKDQLNTLGDEIKFYGNRILFVYGQSHLKQNGVYDRIVHILKNAGIEWFELEGVQPNPRLGKVQQGIDVVRKENLEFILGVGGGSVLDTSKAVALGAKVDYNIWSAYEYFHSDLMHQPNNPNPNVYIPSAALPIGTVITKSGTGSEFDLTSVVTNTETKEKLLIMNGAVYPKFSFCDPTLTYTLSEKEMAYGIADMMTHYFEQYFSPSHNTDFLDYVKEGILKAIIANGRKVLNNLSDYAVRSELMYSATWSCSALNITGVTPEWTSHFIEHEVTALTDLNHGLGMAIIYPAWMKYVSKENPAKFAQYADRVFGVERNGRSDYDMAMEGIKKTQEFWSDLGIPSKLSEVGVDETLFPTIAKQAVRFGPLGSLKQIDEVDVTNILSICK